MPNKTKIGKILVDGGSVYIVHKIKLEVVREKPEKVIYYRPLYKSISNNTLECSIPESNLEISNLKDPHTKAEIKDLMDYLSAKSFKKEDVDLENTTSVLSLNDIYKIAYLIKHFWKEYNTEGVTLTKTKYNLLNHAIDAITEEISHVMGTTLEKGKQAIIKELNKYSKNRSYKVISS
jgi:RNA polymerase-interacting CarD/CdnL/TRCF family regulator